MIAVAMVFVSCAHTTKDKSCCAKDAKQCKMKKKDCKSKKCNIKGKKGHKHSSSKECDKDTCKVHRTTKKK